MHQSIFDYNLSRPYPYRWFTWVVFVGGAVAIVIFSLVNFEVAGFEIDVVYTTNTTEIESPSKTAWYQRRPWSLASKVRFRSKRLKSVVVVTAPPSDDFYLLQPDDQRRLNNQCSEKQNMTLASQAYKNAPIRDCVLSQLHATDEIERGYSDSNSHVHIDVEAEISCAIGFGEQATTLHLSTQFGFTHDGFEPFDTSMLSVFEMPIDYNKTSPSLYWGKELASGYAYQWDQMRSPYSFMNASSDTIKGEMSWDTVPGGGGLNDLLQIQFSFAGPSDSPYVAYWVDQNKTCPSLTNCSTTSLADWAFATFEDEGDHIKIYTEDNVHLVGLNAADPQAFTGLLLDQIGKCFYWTILADLGQKATNVLADPKRLMDYFTNSVKYVNSKRSNTTYLMDNPKPSDYLGGWTPRLQKYESTADFYNALQTSVPNVQPAVFAQEYTCQVPKMKSPGGLIISIIVADLVFLQTLWKILNWLTTLILTRRDPLANYCAGCEERGLLMRVGGEDDVEMGAQEANDVNMSHEAEMAEVDHHIHEASSLMASIDQRASDNEDQDNSDGQSDVAETKHVPTVVSSLVSTGT